MLKAPGSSIRDQRLQGLAAVDQLESLHDMQRGRVRRAVIVDEGLVVHSDGVDDSVSPS